MGQDKDTARFKRDLKSFGLSAAGHIPGVGEALGIHDTYQQGRKLAGSTPKAMNSIKRRIKAKTRSRIRKITGRRFF